MSSPSKGTAQDLDNILGPVPSRSPEGIERGSLDDLNAILDRRTPAVAPTSQKPGYLTSLMRGAAQGGTLGFADEIIGGGDAALNAIEKLSFRDLGKDYERHRDAYRAADAAAKQENPWSFKAGGLGGGIASSFLPGMGLSKGAGFLANLFKVGAQSGLAGYGSSQSKDLSGQAIDSAISSALGMGLFGGFSGLAAAVPTAKSTGGAALELVKRHLRAIPSVKRAFGPQRMDDIAQEVLDSGVLKAGQKVEETAGNLADQAEFSGRVKGDIVDASKATVDPRELRDQLQREVIDPLKGSTANKPLVAKYEAKLAELMDDLGHPIGSNRPPGSPTVITRRTEFVKAKPQTNWTEGNQKIGEVSTPMVEPRVVDVPNADIGPNNLVGGIPRKEVQIFSTGEKVTPVNGYITKKASPPYEIDPNTGLPAKRLVSRRLEANPEVPVQRIETEKMHEQGNINYKNPEPAVPQEAAEAWARVLKKQSEKAIDDPRFLAAKRSTGNLLAAQNMADRTASLTDGGGLLGHLTDLGVGTEAINALLHGNPAGLALLAARIGTKGKISSTGAVTAKAISEYLTSRPALDASLNYAKTGIQKLAPSFSRPSPWMFVR